MSKILVVFHSYTGNTRMVAQMIKDKIDCDILELIPLKPFSSDYQEVVDKYQNNSIKEICELENINIDLNNYDTIILGSPVWWYTLSPVVTTFLKQNNLENKIIFPFATNAGWLGHTFSDVKKLCPNSEVKDGLNILFDSDYKLHKLITKEQKIEDWINSINNI